MTAPIAGAGAVVMRGGEILLIRRGKPPLAGAWSIPGGRIEWGESARAAAIREVREETGCEIEILGLIDVVDRIDQQAGHHFVLVDFAARWVSGEPRPGDDAAEARFVPFSEIKSYGLWLETLRVIEAARRHAERAEL